MYSQIEGRMAHLIKVKDKKGKYTYYAKYKVGGKWKRASLKTAEKKLANKHLKEFQDIEENNVLERIRTNPITLGEFIPQHLEDTEVSNKPSWYKQKKFYFDKYILPFFGEDILLKDITTGDLTRYRNMRRKTVSARSANLEVTVIKTMLNKAKEWGLMPPNYSVPNIKKLKEHKKQPRFLSNQEIETLLEASKNQSQEMYCYCMLMIYAGLRSGEALALRSVDVRLEGRGSIMITPYKHHDENTGKTIVWSPKSHERRSIPLISRLYEYLQTRIKDIEDSTFFVTGNGQYSAYRISRLFLPMVREAGFPLEGENKVSAHTCRHTFASHLVMNGVSLYDVSKMLGHSTIKTTEIYAHLAPDHLQEAVKQIEY